MKTKLLSLFAVSVLLTGAYADPAMIRQMTSQQPDRPVAEAPSGVSQQPESGECTVVCSLPNLAAAADSD